MKIAILGAGPCGIGAAYRLHELGYSNWHIYEGDAHVGGNAASFRDDNGFVWDIGGHVNFSGYPYYKDILENYFGSELNWIKRNAVCWMYDRYIPYPFHLNIGCLPKETLWECLEPLIANGKSENGDPIPNNFKEYLLTRYGQGIYNHFMGPYNAKVWGYDLADMGYYWVKERVADVNLVDLIKNIVFERSDEDWGPNSHFAYPKKGGTGTIWRELAGQLPSDKVSLNKRVSRVDTEQHLISFEDGSVASYDVIVSTIPVVDFVQKACLQDLVDVAGQLKFSSVHAVGLGVKGEIPAHLRDKTWIYYPEGNTPCYRVSVLSNYSENNVPDDKHYSLLCEVSETPEKPVDSHNIVSLVEQGARNTNLIPENVEVISRWHYKTRYGYPTPTVNRDTLLQTLQTELMAKHIFSRGRFGAWRYEVSNQDHSFMQGVEVVNRLLSGEEEVTWKLT